MTDLKPCPFCGIAPRVVEDDSYGGSCVFCPQCDSGFFGVVDAPPADQWNTRASVTREVLRERLTAALQDGDVIEVAAKIAYTRLVRPNDVEVTWALDKQEIWGQLRLADMRAALPAILPLLTRAVFPEGER